MFGAGSGAVQGAVQAREPPLDTMAPCVRFGAGSAGSAVPLPTTIDNVNSLYARSRAWTSVFEFRKACSELQPVEWFAENGRADLTEATMRTRAAFKTEFGLTDELQ